jgi:hypothetical protein
MNKKLNTAPQFVPYIWVSGKLTSNYYFIGRTCMLRDGHTVVATVTEPGLLDILQSEFMTHPWIQISFSLSPLTDSKLEFKKKMWVAGTFNNEKFIGVTCKRNNNEVIAIVTESCRTEEIPFKKGQNLKEISISGDKSTVPPIACSFFGNKNLTTDERLIVKVLISINNRS